MLHDGVLSRQNRDAAGRSPADRRYSRRVSDTSELLLIWLHDPATPIRYRVLDASDGGFRVASACPLVEGMAGIARRVLPQGTTIERAMVVAWSRPGAAGEDGNEVAEFEAGLRYL